MLICKTSEYLCEKCGLVLKEEKDRTLGHGEVRVYRGKGVSRGVQRTTWERSLKSWELQIPCFEEFFWGGNTLGRIPASLPHTLGYGLYFLCPKKVSKMGSRALPGPGGKMSDKSFK